MRTLIIFFITVLWLTETHHEAPANSLAQVSSKDLKCLIRNAYYEAFTEGSRGRQLVTHVVLNRGGVPCATIHKPKQFSWTLRKSLPAIPAEAYRKTRNDVLAVLYGFDETPEHLRSADHYHTTAVRPVWRKGLQKLGVWRNHVFYETRKK